MKEARVARLYSWTWVPFSILCRMYVGLQYWARRALNSPSFLLLPCWASPQPSRESSVCAPWAPADSPFQGITYPGSLFFKDAVDSNVTPIHSLWYSCFVLRPAGKPWFMIPSKFLAQENLLFPINFSQKS